MPSRLFRTFSTLFLICATSSCATPLQRLHSPLTVDEIYDEFRGTEFTQQEGKVSDERSIHKQVE